MADRPFRLVDYFPGLRVEWLAASGKWEIEAGPGTTGVWIDAGVVGDSNSFGWEAILDLSGFTLKEDKTAFFAAQTTQRSLPYAVNVPIGPGQPGVVLTDYMVVSDIPILGGNVFRVNQMGFPADPSDFMSVKYATGSVWSQDNNLPNTMIQTDSFSYGSADPTAAEKLWLYRVITVSKQGAVNNDEVTIPTMRYIAEGVASEEPEFVYLNRLRRSYEQQQS